VTIAPPASRLSAPTPSTRDSAPAHTRPQPITKENAVSEGSTRPALSSAESSPAKTLFVLGATHHRTPIEVREKLALPPDSLTALHNELVAIEGLNELAPLSTCNRTEFYGVASSPEAIARLRRSFCAQQQFPETQFAPYALELQGRAALQHLFEVASGLDSQLVGETEILGQLKDAYAVAHARRSTGPILNRVFQKAFQAAKYVRTHTAITEGQVSVANVAVELARDIFGRLDKIRILLLGAGDIGEKTARAFQSRGVTSLSVSSRRLDRAMALASDLGAFALPFWLAPAKLADFDIVVCATAAPSTVIASEAVDAAMHRRASQPLFLIDLALPRDIDPRVGDQPNVYLYNLDDLAHIAEENRQARESEIALCRQLLTARTDTLWSRLAPQFSTKQHAEQETRL